MSRVTGVMPGVVQLSGLRFLLHLSRSNDF